MNRVVGSNFEPLGDIGDPVTGTPDHEVPSETEYLNQTSSSLAAAVGLEAVHDRMRRFHGQLTKWHDLETGLETACSGRDPLRSSSASSHEPATVRQGASDNFDDTSDDLFDAVDNDEIETVRQILQRNAPFDINRAWSERHGLSRLGMSPLHLACKRVHTDIFKLLILQTDIDVNQRDIYGMVPLHHACLHSADTIVDILLEIPGIIINAQTKRSQKTPLHDACMFGSVTCISRLLRAPGICASTRDSRGCLALHYAAARGDASQKVAHDLWPEVSADEMQSCIRGLLRYGGRTDVNVATEDDAMTPLHMAAQSRNLPAVEILLEQLELKLDAKTRDGDTALHFAMPDVRIAEALLDRGLNVNARNNDGIAAIHLATSLDSYDAVKFLVERRDTRINLKSKAGKTALHIAVSESCPAVLQRLLITPGISLDSRDCEGNSPLHIAVQKGDLGYMKLILEVMNTANASPANLRGALFLACTCSDDMAHAVKYLLTTHRVDPNYPLRNGCRAIHYAAELGHFNTVKVLLEHGADPRVPSRGNFICSPEDIASAAGHHEVAYMIRGFRCREIRVEVGCERMRNDLYKLCVVWIWPRTSQTRECGNEQGVADRPPSVFVTNATEMIYDSHDRLSMAVFGQVKQWQIRTPLCLEKGWNTVRDGMSSPGRDLVRWVHFQMNAVSNPCELNARHTVRFCPRQFIPAGLLIRIATMRQGVSSNPRRLFLL